MKMRKLFVSVLFITSLFGLIGCNGNDTDNTTSLVFPTDSYTTKTMAVTTSAGDKEVTYRFYNHITYVSNPVDENYESMNVSVPVSIDGVTVDATNAPILFVINVAGYTSSINSSSTGLLSDSFPGGTAPGGTSSGSSNSDLALAAGYVVVSPGCRGRDNQALNGTYYGKAPAAIVDLKSAVRYIHYNAGIMPGNANWIISSGSSAGGALSALLGASGNSDLYDAYFEELGAADADDKIYASACYCPITDLDHADGAYEWEFGATALSSGLVDQTLSQELKDIFTDYQASLNLTGQNDFGTITADNYAEYLLKTYLIPSANKYLSALTDSDRASYLSNNAWITWADNTASFTYADYVAYIGRMKSLPAFDAFDLSTAECILFGNETTNARHFTDFSLRYTSGDDSAEIEDDLQTVVNLMNPMYFIGQKNSGCADYWWIRHGTKDTDTSRPVIINLATSLENLNKDVNTWLYWDAGHGANEDAENFIAWIGNITGYTN